MKQPRVLFLDTSSQNDFQILIIEKEKIVFNKKFKASNRLDDIFKELKKIDLNRIGCFVTNIGPKNLSGENASFTGLRISSVIGNTLVLANRVKLIAIKTEKEPRLSEIVALIVKKINAGRFEKILLPKYSNKPNITKKRPIC